MITLNIGTVPGLSADEQQKLIELQNVFAYHQSKNDTKDKYYEGHIELSDVNLGIALPQGLNKLKVGCNWGQKAVDVLAARSMFDGFVGTAGSLGGLSKLVQDNRPMQILAARYGFIRPRLRRHFGTEKRGASTAGLPLSTRYRTRNTATSGCRSSSTCTQPMRYWCCTVSATAGACSA